MRKNSNNWSVSCAVKAGHHHMYKGSNCQDAAVIRTTPDIAIGIGCDGCGEGQHSEMGALSIANFALNKTMQFHTAGYNPEQILEPLFTSIVNLIYMNVMV